jgi:hypothetical protein
VVTKQEFVDWRAELEAIHREMDEVIKSAWLHTAQEREVRRTQFQALIERRNTAARKFLQPKRSVGSDGLPLSGVNRPAPRTIAPLKTSS